MANAEEREYLAELVAKIRNLEAKVPSLKGEVQRILNEDECKVLAQAEQHSADSMRDLLLAEERFEQKQKERAVELRVLKEARQTGLAELRRAFTEGTEELNKKYEQGAARLVEAGQAEAQAVASAAKTAEACKENARAIATAQGFSEKFWDNNKPGRAQPMATHAKTRTAAEVVSGPTQTPPAGAEELAERERQAQYAADLRDLERRSRATTTVHPVFFAPEKRQFKVLTDDEEDHAIKAFGVPGEHITFNGLAIIALRQGRASLYDATFAEVCRKLVAVLHEDMTLHNISRVNSETMELVVPAEFYPQMCMYLSRVGRVLATTQPCYLTGHSDRMMEPTPMSTIARWQKEARTAKSMEGRMWYTASIAAHEQNLCAEARTRQFVPLAERRTIGSRPHTEGLTDTEGFETQNKRGQSAHSSNFTDGAPTRQLNLAAQNKFNLLAMDMTEDSDNDSTNSTTNNSSNDDISVQSTNNLVGSPSHISGGQSSY
ncbi:hypothetical protein GGI08_005528 [Coemansia sp. S2]|nr:hypothetical protein GGI08_005528 [Coemansia sp. S2]